MVSPRGEMPTYATDNKNGFLSSLLAWIGGPKEIIGSRDHAGFHVWDSDTDSEALAGLPSACKTSLTQLVRCDIWASTFLGESYRGSLHNDTLTDSVCDESCGESLKSWFDSVATDCAGYNVSSSAPTKYGGQIWSGWNETCLKDPTTDEYCNGKLSPPVFHIREYASNNSVQILSRASVKSTSRKTDRRVNFAASAMWKDWK